MYLFVQGRAFVITGGRYTKNVLYITSIFVYRILAGKYQIFGADILILSTS